LTASRIPSDTIDSVISYISYLEGYGYKFDESVEKTFQSNQDIWRSIDAPSFIDKARAYFHNRRMIFQLLNSSTSFRRPVDQEQIRQVYAAALRAGKDVDWYAFLRKTLQEEDVLLYIQLHYQRQSILNLGTPLDYQQQTTASYQLPLNKLPIFDWLNSKRFWTNASAPVSN